MQRLPIGKRCEPLSRWQFIDCLSRQISICEHLCMVGLSTMTPYYGHRELTLKLTRGALLMLQAVSKNFSTLAALRALSGAAEACFDPSVMIIIGMWYTRKEQPIRIGLWYSANGVGIAVGGILGYGIGQIKGALASWKYEFLIMLVFSSIKFLSSRLIRYSLSQWCCLLSMGHSYVRTFAEFASLCSIALRKRAYFSYQSSTREPNRCGKQALQMVPSERSSAGL